MLARLKRLFMSCVKPRASYARPDTFSDYSKFAAVYLSESMHSASDVETVSSFDPRSQDECLICCNSMPAATLVVPDLHRASTFASDCASCDLSQACSEFLSNKGQYPVRRKSREITSFRWIGLGAFGVVCKALWQGSPVAVKFVLSNDVNGHITAATEALLCKLLAHPNVVQTFCCDMDLVADGDFDLTDDASSFGLHSPQSAFADVQLPLSHFIDVLGSTGDTKPLGTKDDDQSMKKVMHVLKVKPGDYLTRIVMEYCDKGSLQTAMDKGLFKPGRWSPATTLRAVVRTAKEIAQGLSHLHSINVIHGDLKPSNILLKSSRVDRRKFVAKVSDFGLSKMLFGNLDIASLNHTHGTATHMAPELISGQVSKASDVYALGVVLWQLGTGEQPYAGLHQAHILAGVQDGSLRLNWPVASNPELVQLATACLAHNPAERPDVADVVSTLAVLEAGLRSSAAGFTASPPSSPAAVASNAPS